MISERNWVTGVSRAVSLRELKSAASGSRSTSFPSRWLRLAGAIGAALFLLGAGPTRAQAQAYSVVHSFSGSDGKFITGGIVADSAGNLYGTTNAGGSSSLGVVFELNASNGYAETILHTFAAYPSDGSNPYAGLLIDSSGNLYGTTVSGGACGQGTVFELTASNNYAETLLYSFGGSLCSSSDAAYPYAGLVRDSSGDLFGTTTYGGSSNNGAVFELTPSGGGYNESVLHSFQGPPSDGQYPQAGLAFDSSGNLYGTTVYGGSSLSSYGVVFELTASSGYTSESVLHNFSGLDGVNPYGSLVVDSSGKVYGTTLDGGPSGLGEVFELDASNSYALTVLDSFAAPTSDGSFPYDGLFADSSGNLYGTTSLGGSSDYGVVFELNKSNGYAETALHSFAGPPGDGAGPVAGITQDTLGNLYGTTKSGGSSNLGTAFKIATAVPFASLTATLNVTGGTSPGFNLKADFTLGSGSPGIDPPTQALTVQIGSYTLTIPAGSFQALPHGKFNYSGTVNGVAVSAQLVTTGPGAYSLHVSGTGVDLTGLPSPVTITITIGDNTGSTLDPGHSG